MDRLTAPALASSAAQSPDQGTFVAFVPLSNWLRGFDRYRSVYSKALLPESTYPTHCYVLPEASPEVSLGHAKAQRLVQKLGIPGDRVVVLRTRLPQGPGLAEPNRTTGTGIGWQWPHPELPLAAVGWADAPHHRQWLSHEHITAHAYALLQQDLTAWSDCRPRSFSILPVAQACNANCAFCFSKASVSELARQTPMTLASVTHWARRAKEAGAERAVITGGGEPTLWSPPALLAGMAGLREHFSKVVLITNGAKLAARNPAERLRRLRAYADAGLTCLTLSRHGVDAASDARILGLAVDTTALWTAAAQVPELRRRVIGVLQRGGVDHPEAVHAYLRRCAAEGVQEVCFKELYVSSLSENPWAPSAENRYCADHQVPLAMVMRTLEALGFVQVSALPWGSPVYAGVLDGQRLTVAAYTEPSVGWERSHGVVRSWNLYADGQCFASLEDPQSRLDHA